jgi:hypothetical protein
MLSHGLQISWAQHVVRVLCCRVEWIGSCCCHSRVCVRRTVRAPPSVVERVESVRGGICAQCPRCTSQELTTCCCRCTSQELTTCCCRCTSQELTTCCCRCCLLPRSPSCTWETFKHLVDVSSTTKHKVSPEFYTNFTPIVLTQVLTHSLTQSL